MRKPAMPLIGFMLLCACVLITVLIAPRYRPALVAAPGHQMRLVTAPANPIASRIKRLQAIAEITPCSYQLLGWTSDSVLIYASHCTQGEPPQVWAVDTGTDALPRQIGVPPGDLLLDSADVFEMLRATEHGRDDEPNRRRLALVPPQLAAPDGRWVALVAAHFYGPQDVLLVER